MPISETKPIVELAATYFENQNWKEAKAAYQAIVDANPYNGKYWYRLGEVQYREKNYVASTEAFQKSIELGFYPPGAMYHIGRNFSLQNQPDEAVFWLEKVTKTFHSSRYLSMLETDPDLDNLRNDIRFQKLPHRS